MIDLVDLGRQNLDKNESVICLEHLSSDTRRHLYEIRLPKNTLFRDLTLYISN